MNCEQLLKEIKARLAERTPELKRKAPSIYLDQVYTDLETLTAMLEVAREALGEIRRACAITKSLDSEILFKRINHFCEELDRLANGETK